MGMALLKVIYEVVVVAKGKSNALKNTKAKEIKSQSIRRFLCDHPNGDNPPQFAKLILNKYFR